MSYIYTSTERYQAVQVVPENYVALKEWGVDFTGPTMQIDNMWVVRGSLGSVVAILHEEDFEKQFSPNAPEAPDPLVESEEYIDGETS